MMITWLIDFFLRPEFFGTLAILCGIGYVVCKITLQPLLATVCELAGIIFAVMTAYAWADNRGYARAETEYKPQVEAAKLRASNAEGANVKLAANLHTLDATLADQATAGDRIKTAQATAQAAAKAAIAWAAESSRVQTGEIERLQALAAPASGPVIAAATPEEDCAAADAVLRDVMRQRLGVTP